MNKTFLRALVLLIACAAPTRVALAQNFTGCGTLVTGGICPLVFQSDLGGTYFVSNTGSFQLGDHVLVTGTFALCPTVCMITNGCILQNTIAPCSTGTPICFGDGSGAPCPCANSGAAGHGCANSVSASGGLITANGNASVSADTLVLSGSSMPSAAVLYFQGTATVAGGQGTVFGDGLRCVNATVIRLGTKINSGGASHFPESGDASISVRGFVNAGDVKFYQMWYRNAAAFCTPSTFNLSNGLEVTWQA